MYICLQLCVYFTNDDTLSMMFYIFNLNLLLFSCHADQSFCICPESIVCQYPFLFGNCGVSFVIVGLFGCVPYTYTSTLRIELPYVYVTEMSADSKYDYEKIDILEKHYKYFSQF